MIPVNLPYPRLNRWARAKLSAAMEAVTSRQLSELELYENCDFEQGQTMFSVNQLDSVLVATSDRQCSYVPLFSYSMPDGKTYKEYVQGVVRVGADGLVRYCIAFFDSKGAVVKQSLWTAAELNDEELRAALGPLFEIEPVACIGVLAA